MADFGNYEGRLFAPQYSDIDWSRRRDIMINNGELDEYKPRGFDSGDGLVTEVHQENLTIRLNRVAPDMDMIAVKDPRDGLDYVWFRETDPQRFAVLVEKLGRAALVVTTEYPFEDTVKIYLDRAETGIDTDFLGELDG